MADSRIDPLEPVRVQARTFHAWMEQQAGPEWEEQARTNTLQPDLRAAYHAHLLLQRQLVRQARTMERARTAPEPEPAPEQELAAEHEVER